MGQQQGHRFSASVRHNDLRIARLIRAIRIGGGLEYLFTPNWSAKGEYMYTSLGSETYNLLGDLLDSGNIDFHTIKVGVNYHFR